MSRSMTIVTNIPVKLSLLPFLPGSGTNVQNMKSDPSLVVIKQLLVSFFLD